MKSLFLGTALLATAATGFAQKRTDATSPQQKIMQENKALKWGVLLIQGPEHPDSTDLIEKELYDIAAFYKSFAKWDHKVLGGPTDSLDFGKAKAALKELGENNDAVLVFVNMHGKVDTAYHYLSDSSGVEGLTNGLQAAFTDEKKSYKILSSDMYKEFGRLIEHEKCLRGKPIIFAHMPCSGAATGLAFTYLPPPCVGITYAEQGKGSWLGERQIYNAFGLSLNEQQATWQPTFSNVKSEIILQGDVVKDTAQRHFNDMKIFYMTHKRPNSIKIQNEKFEVGKYGGYVVDCKKNALCIADTYSGDEIYNAIRQVDTVSGKRDAWSLGLFYGRGLRNYADLEKMWGPMHGFMDCAIDQIVSSYPDRQISIAQWAWNEGMILKRIKPPEEPKLPQFPTQPPLTKPPSLTLSFNFNQP